MATLWIKEFESMPHLPGGGVVQIWAEPEAVLQAVSISGTHAESSAFGTGTKFIAITSDSTFCYTVGSAPVATTAKWRVVADSVLVFAVTGGHKISAITTT